MTPGGGRKPPDDTILLLNLIAQCRSPGPEAAAARGRLREALRARGFSGPEAETILCRTTEDRATSPDAWSGR